MLKEVDGKVFMTKLKRYHIDIYYPEWSNDSLTKFTDNLIGKRLVCSFHATKRYEKLSVEYQKVVRDLLKTVDLQSSMSYIFEFYANKNNEIKKVCYRFHMGEEFKSDAIFVVSSNCKLVTLFFNKSYDPHYNLDRSLYEQGDMNEES